MARYNVTGITDIAKGPKGHLGWPKVVLSFASDTSGIIGLRSAEATLEEMVEVVKPSPKPKLKRKPLFAKKTNATSESNDTTSANTTLPDADSDSTAEDASLPNVGAGTAAVEALFVFSPFP